MNLFEQIIGAQSADEAHNLTAEQQITRLTEYFAQVFAAEPERFEPGQIIWHKNAGMACIRGAENPHMFLDYLDQPIVLAERATIEPHSSYAVGILDCRVLVLADFTHAATYLMDSRVWTATEPKASHARKAAEKAGAQQQGAASATVQ